MVINEQDIKAYFKVLAVLNEDLDTYGEWMDKIEVDWLAALNEFIDIMRSGRDTIKKARLLRQALGIREGDRQFFQRGASNQKEATQFLISNTLLSGESLGVIEDVEASGDLIQQIAAHSPTTL